MEYLGFGRTDYAEPLTLVTTVEADTTPALDALDVGTDWLELVVIPAGAAIWILRDGDLVGPRSGAGT